MNKLLISLLSVLLIFCVLVFSIAINSFKDKKFTCNKYLLNTYLYILLTFNILAIMMLSMEYKKVNFRPNFLVFIGIFLLSLGCIFAIHAIDSEKVLLKHLVWLTFVLLLGLIFYPMYSSIPDKKIVISAIITTLSLVLVLSAFAYAKPEYISLSWGPVLLMLLIGVIIFELITLIIMGFTKSYNSMLLRGISYFVIFLFMGFILYDTKRLQINAKACVKADYIKESLSLFLDIFNIFVRILGLNMR